MAETQKFLDQAGVQHLWSKISMEDYPNNEVLISVLNAIDETKLDKSVFEEYTGNIVALHEPADDDIPKIYIDGTIPSTKDEVLATLKYKSKTNEFFAYIKIKCQGTFSMGYPKKNFTIKMYEDAEYTTKLKRNFRGWGNQNKYCLKANYIDLSHARNICCARLWAECVKSRDGYENYPEEYRTSPNQGAIDGFPILVYCNGHYWGRYTWNIPKDAWMANMDDSLDTHCILCSEDYKSSCFRAAALIDESDWTDELHDEVPESILTGWNEVIDFVMNSSDEDFVTNLANHFDVESLIDYYLFSYVICHLDGLGKNQLFFTYDGTHWIAGAYDMDSTAGLYWDGSYFVSTSYQMQSDYETGVNGTSNLLYDRIASLFTDAIVTRWGILKDGALSKQNLIDTFEEFCDIVPHYIVERDYNVNTGLGDFTTIPSVADNNICQIREYLVNRYEYVNARITGSTATGENLLRENYSPNGSSWVDTASVNFIAGDYIEVSLNTTNCANMNENILSVGTDIANWIHTGYHIYYTTGTIQVNTLDGVTHEQFTTYVNSNDSVIRIDSNGCSINGKIIATCPNLESVTSIQIGSVEGSIRSQATYNYIKVVNV